MDLDLKGKTAIVTGASQGIGRAITQALHAEGVAVVMVARTAATLKSAADAIASETATHAAPLHPIVADLGLGAEIQRVVHESLTRLGHIDILVNNAAQARYHSFFKEEEATLDAAWQVKALGYVRMVRAVAPHMMERGSGEIINIVGNTARTPTEDFIIGSMVNAALVNFTRGVSRELARRNVRINSISPGWTRTEGQARSFNMQAAARGLTPEEIERRDARAVPLGHLVSMDEVARLTVCLAAGLFPSMTGEDILLDGGAATSI